MFKEDHLSFRQRKYMKVKNIIGRALGGIGLVVLSPVYLAIIVAIKKEDGITAPVFFSQKRVGIHKEYFNLYKFRSMRTDTPHDKPTHLLENPDQYITKVGRFLRKSSLDELPQLWNIARGDMAVIGPRPALWNQDDLIAERDKYGANDVKPGLTGWAQINGRDELEIPVKARLDGEYVKKMGPLMDIRCFIGTVFSVLRSDGVVEGGTGAKKKLMVITNHSYMLWQFRRELIGKLMEDYDVIISTPFVGHEDDFAAMGCTMIETDVDRRGINPKTDMKLYLTYMHQLYAEGLINQEYLTLDGTSRFDAAKSGQVAFIGSGEGNSLAAEDFPDGEFHLDCMAPLTSEYDDDQTILGKSGYFGNGGFFLNKDSKYITEMCRMFDIMYATEEVVPGSGLLGESFTYGIKGVDWDYDEGDAKTYTLTAPESYDGAFTTYQYEEVIWDGAGLSDALAGYVTSTPGNSQARQLGFVNNVIPYQSDIYFPASMLKFTEDEQYVLDNKLTDIQTYYKEMEGKFITGVVDIDSGWDTYCQTLDQMGVQDVLDGKVGAPPPE